MSSFIQKHGFVLVAFLGFCLSACSDDSTGNTGGDLGGDVATGPWLADPLRVFPNSLSEIGLYPMAPDLTQTSDLVAHYESTWPGWFNGTALDTYFAIPQGQTIDNNDRSVWLFPPGSVFFMTLLFGDETEGGPIPVETRVLRATAEGWDYAAYQWNDEHTDATLLDGEAPVPVSVTQNEETFEHQIPATLVCQSCHMSDPAFLLGFDELQLNSAFPGADGTQLEELAADGYFSNDIPPDPVQVDHDDEATEAVLGFVEGNCTYCHNGWTGPWSHIDLRHGVFIETTVNQPIESRLMPAGTMIVPGSPEDSILYQAFILDLVPEDPEFMAMPPLGLQRRDTAAAETLRDWILQLGAQRR